MLVVVVVVSHDEVDVRVMCHVTVMRCLARIMRTSWHCIIMCHVPT
jgi:hypothetical protein